MMLTRSQLEDWATSSWTLRLGLWLPAFSQNTQPHLNEERFEGWMSALHYSNPGFRNPLCLKMPFVHTICSIYMTMVQKRDTKCQVNHKYLSWIKNNCQGIIILEPYHIRPYIYIPGLDYLGISYLFIQGLIFDTGSIICSYPKSPKTSKSNVPAEKTVGNQS